MENKITPKASYKGVGITDTPITRSKIIQT